MDHLPKYDPHSHVAKRKTSRVKAALNSVHIIPIIVVLCSIILWFFSDSTPSAHGVERELHHGSDPGQFHDYSNQTEIWGFMIPWGRIYFGGFHLRMVNHDETGVAYECWLPQLADACLFLGEKKAEELIYYLIDDRAYKGAACYGWKGRYVNDNGILLKPSSSVLGVSHVTFSLLACFLHKRVEYECGLT